jgi:Skp family chaperone for outer membrane proteins
MRRLALAASLAVLLSAASAFAQAPAPQTAAPPAPATTPSAPATTPSAPPAQAPVPAPFPAGAKVAFVDFQRVAAESVEGQLSSARINALVQKKQGEGAEKAKQLQANEQRLAQSGAVMSEAARAQLEKDIERQKRETERFQQDAQAEITELQQELQRDFQQRISPLVQQIVHERGLQLLLSRADAGIVWGEPGLDLTSDFVKKLDALTPRPAQAPASKAAAPPASAAPRPPTVPAAAAPRPTTPAPAAPPK